MIDVTISKFDYVLAGLLHLVPILYLRFLQECLDKNRPKFFRYIIQSLWPVRSIQEYIEYNIQGLEFQKAKFHTDTCRLIYNYNASWYSTYFPGWLRSVRTEQSDLIFFASRIRNFLQMLYIGPRGDKVDADALPAGVPLRFWELPG